MYLFEFIITSLNWNAAECQALLLGIRFPIRWSETRARQILSSTPVISAFARPRNWTCRWTNVQRMSAEPTDVSCDRRCPTDGLALNYKHVTNRSQKRHRYDGSVQHDNAPSDREDK